MLDVAVIGGGISGLAAAYALKTEGGGKVKQALFEKENRVGGWIKTLRREGFLFDLGPHTIRTRGTGLEALRLALSLNLQNEILFPAKASHARYILQNGELEKAPSGFLSLIFSPLSRKLLPALLREPFVARGNNENETVADFFARRFSKDLADTFIDPLMKGIFAGDSRQLSLRACFPDLSVAETTHRSLILWMLFGDRTPPPVDMQVYKRQGPLFSFRQGMATLTDALEKDLQDTLFKGEEVVKLTFDKTWTITLLSGKQFKARSIITALPLPPLKKLLGPLLPEAACGFEIPYASLAVVPIGFKSKLHQVPEGFGYLVPSQEKSPLLGAIFDSSIFPSQGEGSFKTRMTAMLGGALHPGFLQQTDEEIKETALKEISRHLKIKPLQPDFIEVHRIASAIPQYGIAHCREMARFQQELKTKLPTLQWIGSSVGGVSVGDCIHTANRAAAETLRACLLICEKSKSLR
ncbi:protoporphyrinogen oxidase [Estrella lausannensis]|uniref:Coproporphyrinogen III oxidase n=1 Tax=Estrella lausannensis TaxID=483423 RepID=A0A0H5DQ35_9BACT|nr:protoporphyrinogen oxidase [Estrella lausannensis]CRX37634.1 putative protoporphyrinogen oxidase [Estrella lausannensis]